MLRGRPLLTSLTTSPPLATDEWLFGWDDTPAIVSVWADRSGRALVWRRIGQQVICEQERYRPWIYAQNLDDLDTPRANEGISYKKLTGGSGRDYRYIITGTTYGSSAAPHSG